VQGRLTGKQYPDTSTVTCQHRHLRLQDADQPAQSVTDAASQVKTYGYAKDDRLLRTATTRSFDVKLRSRPVAFPGET
jgi:hypothetical protein